MKPLIEVGAPDLPDGVVLERPADSTLRLRANTDIRSLATGWFARPSASVPLRLAADAGGAEVLGFAFTQFAMPVVASAELDFDFNPAPNLHSPPAVGLLLVRDGDRCSLLAPITNVHEQVISVEANAPGGALRWGWHGDLDEVPAGFETTLAVYDGTSPGELLARWAREVRGGPVARACTDNPVVSHLSYWTDNGAAYWYRTEARQTIARSVADVVTQLRNDGVPVRAVELDSWFYPHETARPIAEIGYPSDVPPTGMLTWTPRADAFDAPPDDANDGRDAIERWADALGRPPLILHSRHVAPTSPYVDDGWWVDALAAQPKDPDFFARWFADAARSGRLLYRAGLDAHVLVRRA